MVLQTQQDKEQNKPEGWYAEHELQDLRENQTDIEPLTTVRMDGRLAKCRVCVKPIPKAQPSLTKMLHFELPEWH